jgi:hypothetical protein
VTDSLRLRFSLDYRWRPDSTYHLVLNKNFAEDSTGKKLLRTDTITFKAKRESDYGKLRLRFPNLDLARHPVLLFVQNEAVVQTAPFTNKEFNQRLFKPGDYTLRILYDDNQNGRWDHGSFFGTRRQPEIVQAINGKPVTVKANWENDQVISW